MIIYRELNAEEMDISMFSSFDRTQNVTKCWRKIDGKWEIKDVPFMDTWSDEEYREGVQYLRQLIISGGYVSGAFCEGKLKGFVSVEPTLFGTAHPYMDLSNLHVSREMRGQGIGKELFALARNFAKNNGAEKLYISAHSSVESQAFYQAMGCVEAVEYNKMLQEREPCDCQLECAL